jgi:hypothetical protein
VVFFGQIFALCQQKKIGKICQTLETTKLKKIPETNILMEWESCEVWMVGLVNKKGTLKSILYKPVLGGSLVFSENCRVWELECFERPDLVFKKYIFSSFKDAGRVSKICNFFFT